MTPYTFHPHPEQELLLAAALLPGEEALSAWAQWRVRVHFEKEDWDVGSFRLLPLVYGNLQRQGWNDPLMERLKGIYRRAWTESQLQQRVVVDVMDGLQAAGTPCLLLGNPEALPVSDAEGNPYPLIDAELFVLPGQAPAAVEGLARLGWSPVGGTARQLTAERFVLRPSQPFTNAQRRTVILHWRALGDWQMDRENDSFWTEVWTEAHSLTVAYSTLPSLSPPARIVRLATQACAWTPLPRYDKLAEIVLRLRRGKDENDWERLVQLAQQRRVTLSVYASLQYINRLFAGIVPQAVLENLRQAPFSSAEEKLFRSLARPPRLPGQIGRAWQFYQRYQAQAAAGIFAEKPGGFVGYLGAYASTNSLPALLRWSAHRLLRTS